MYKSRVFRLSLIIILILAVVFIIQKWKVESGKAYIRIKYEISKNNKHETQNIPIAINLLVNIFKLNSFKKGSVLDYGAKCDGNNIDTQAFKEAFNFLDVIYIPSGICLIDFLEVPSSKIIYGEGRSSVIKLAPQKVKSKDHRAVFHVVGKSLDEKAQNVHFFDLTIDGNKSAHHGRASAGEGIKFTFSENSSATNIFVINALHNGIQTNGSNSIYLINNIVIGSDSVGIYLSDDGKRGDRGSRNNYIIGNFAYKNAFYKKKRGIDQNKGSFDNYYYKNLSADNYKNYEFNNKVKLNQSNIQFNSMIRD